jgi:hypothetical protein
MLWFIDIVFCSLYVLSGVEHICKVTDGPLDVCHCVSESYMDTFGRPSSYEVRVKRELSGMLCRSVCDKWGAGDLMSNRKSKLEPSWGKTESFGRGRIDCICVDNPLRDSTAVGLDIVGIAC